MESTTTVIIADDHPIFRQGLRQIIEADAGLTIVADAEDGERALELIRDLQPRVAVLDVDMPRKDGFAVAREIQSARWPVAIVFLTMHKNEPIFNAAMDLGVTGFVLKDSAASEIVTAVRAVAAGHGYVTPLLTDFLLHRSRARALTDERTGLGSLTLSERRVLKLVADGRSSKAIADELLISVRTVDRHRANIAAKLDLKGSHALMQFAIAHKSQI
jgi:DNA-binding NarL/FixJ family response regulator